MWWSAFVGIEARDLSFRVFSEKIVQMYNVNLKFLPGTLFSLVVKRYAERFFFFSLITAIRLMRDDDGHGGGNHTVRSKPLLVACKVLAHACRQVAAYLSIHTMVPRRISLVAVLFCCLVATQTHAKIIRDERRETYQNNRTGKLRGETSANSLNNQRRLFAERWSDPSNPQRGGAGGAAKGLTEFVPMRPSPSVAVPTVQSPEQAPVPVPTTPQPVIASTPAPQSLTPVAPVPPVSTIATTPTQSPANRNDVCSRAKSVPVSAEGMGVEGVLLIEDTTLGAQTASAERCNTLATTAPGVWFVVSGTYSAVLMCHGCIHVKVILTV